MTPTRLLFFTPFGSKTGSEMYLDYVLRRYDRAEWACGVYFDKRGPLTESVPADVPSFVSPYEQSGLTKLYHKTAFYAQGNAHTERQLVKIQHHFKADYWYFNTILMCYYVKYAKRLGIPVILHLHELPSIYEMVSYDDLKETLEYATLVIAASEGAAHVVRQMGFDKVKVCHPFVDMAQIKPDAARIAELQTQHQLDNKYVWLMSGSMNYRKGIDFLPDLAQELADTQAHILWAGGGVRSGLVYLAEQQLAQLGLKNVTLLGLQSADYYNYMSLANGFVLTSREDPFPMVMMEAAHLGKPIVGFDCGGPREFLREGMGVVVDHFEPKELAQAMRNVMENRVFLNPKVSHERASAFDSATQIRHWEATIRQLIRETV